MHKSSRCNSSLGSLCLSAQSPSNHTFTMTLFAVRLAIITFIATFVKMLAQQDLFTHWTLPMRCSVVGIFVGTFVVKGRVLTGCKQFKIFKSIVAYFMIFVVYVFPYLKTSAQMLFHNPTMFSKVSSIRSHYSFVFFSLFSFRQVKMSSTIAGVIGCFYTICNFTFVHKKCLAC